MKSSTLRKPPGWEPLLQRSPLPSLRAKVLEASDRQSAVSPPLPRACGQLPPPSGIPRHTFACTCCGPPRLRLSEPAVAVREHAQASPVPPAGRVVLPAATSPGRAPALSSPADHSLLHTQGCARRARRVPCTPRALSCCVLPRRRARRNKAASCSGRQPSGRPHRRST